MPRGVGYGSGRMRPMRSKPMKAKKAKKKKKRNNG